MNSSVQKFDPKSALVDAQWITIDDGIPPGERPAYDFRTVFDLPQSSCAATARLTVTAHGIYEAFLNGMRIGDDELRPGFTSYSKTLYVQQYDVSSMLRPGSNELRLRVSDGWYRGRCGYSRFADSFGNRIAVIASLNLDGDDHSQRIDTDGRWQVTVSEIVQADLMDGQTTDFTRIGHESWQPVAISSDPLTSDRERFAIDPAPPIRCCERYVPRSITRLASGRQIVDFGQNISGWVRLSELGPAGTRITLTHGEALNTDGDLTTDHLRALVGPEMTPLEAGQIDHVISRGREEDVFEPRHTTHGFRYVAVDGLANDLSPDDISAFQVRNDLTHIGTFSCGNDEVNALHRIAVASWRANSCAVPTDCPQRERSGYTGDIQIFAHTAAFLDDIDSFLRSWLRSLADDQLSDGRVTNVAPNCGNGPDYDPNDIIHGAGGWGDAATVVPWELYQAYGDIDALRENYQMMKRWVEFQERKAASSRHRDRVAARPTPAPHERYIWDTGWQWGEWLEPDMVFDPVKVGFWEQGIVATAYFAHSAEILSRTAHALGRADDELRFGKLAELVRLAWRAEFMHDDGTLVRDTQASYVRALRFGLIPEPLRPAAAARLAKLIEDDGCKLATGFLSTGMLLPTLADYGYADLAYRLLLGHDEPGWMVMLDRGATTVWENWHGVDEQGHPTESLNHYSKGAVITFLHEYTAGLKATAPGYRSFTVRPYVYPPFDHAKATLESPYGRIEAGWQVDGDAVIVTVHVPESTEATVVLPDGTRCHPNPGDHAWTYRL
ncbi:alpha-L-rhamnosidase [Bifidobacterium margollesii]|uniref:alpha-L-rhamnosidase n=1 Tax=Bifidobacterium margollesii TaxID=2020964 RepID=A0A2N5JAD1_9BIFI|nr:alpha-L-rhamnosidase [Bifidobacterium margollesii]PLS31172.1 alpha-L-rhamnosidase [Bifidobacterium margollesii]